MRWSRHVLPVFVTFAFARAWSACTYDFTIGSGTADGGATSDGSPASDAPSSGRQPIACVGECTCAAGQSCELSCTGPGCNVRCAASSDCVVKCNEGSACEITCEADASCAIDCTKGNCTSKCDGNCSSIQCSGGLCSCEGTGCP